MKVCVSVVCVFPNVIDRWMLLGTLFECFFFFFLSSSLLSSYPFFSSFSFFFPVNEESTAASMCTPLLHIFHSVVVFYLL